jgi:spoIIIJ-associated protein
MIREFEGKTEKEAIDNAIAELGLDRDEFDVEIIDEGKKGLLFRKGNVKVRIHVTDSEEESGFEEPEDEYEREIVEFVENCIEKMGFPGEVNIDFREDNKLGLSIDSRYSGILIGKKGKNLDALQLLTNVYAGKYASRPKVIVDAERYRERREETLIRMARKVAEQVRRDHKSKLLEPMNPFERRLIHTSLNEMEDIATKSEGEGLYKQIRVFYRGK